MYVDVRIANYRYPCKLEKHATEFQECVAIGT